MILKQYYLGCLSHASYLIADERTKTAVIVDPQRDIEQYLEDAAELGMTIKHVFLTHFHADFLAGHIELRDRTGAKIYLGAKAEAQYEFTSLKEGDVVEFGDVRLKILETPGHTPEGISILVYDLQQDAVNPHAVLTGDTLFIGDVGRPDLMASIGVTADELGEMLYDSLTNKLMKLPDETLVYPAHGAGSLCGKNLSDETVSTIGEQKKYNYALKPMSKQKFIDLVTEEQPDAPEYFIYDAIKNREERSSLEQSMQKSMKSLSLKEVLQKRDEGVQIVDVREAVDFDAGHLKGAINIGLKGKYATWAGTLLSHEEPIIVIAEQGGEEEAIMRLGRIGFDNVVGYLESGVLALDSRPDEVQAVERITAQALVEKLDAGDELTVLDIRSPKERETGAIAGSLNIPLNQLTDRLAEVPREGTIVVHCAGGYRSAISASVLQKHGFENVMDLVGGYKAWETSFAEAQSSK